MVRPVQRYFCDVPWSPPPGSIGLTRAYGYAGFVNTIAHLATAERLRYTHAFIVLDAVTAMEPWPSGARIVDLAEFDGMPVAYVWLPALDEEDRRRLVTAARALDGTPYLTRDVAAAVLWRLGWRGRRLERTLALPRRLTPGQFVAETYRRSAVRLLGSPHEVTVGDLAGLTVTVERWEQWASYA